MRSLKNFQFDFWMIVSLILLVVLAGSLLLNTQGGVATQPLRLREEGRVVKLVSAAEIYPQFLCPCCGKLLDKNNICCEMARERINFIDSLVAEGKGEREIVLAYLKKYGLASLADQKRANELKDELKKSAPADRPIISLTPTTYDFGEVSLKKGTVTTSFLLKNEGKSDLIIQKLDSSCGCTSASVVYQGVEGPRFAMAGHGIENPTNWQLAIAPESQAELKVYYDPTVHPDFRGPATREIYVFSNDPVDFEKKVVVELNQID